MPIKKYELLADNITTVKGTVLHRIRAIRDFGEVKQGELGGWIASEVNLSQSGGAWVFGEARVSDDARVSGRDFDSVAHLYFKSIDRRKK